MSPNFSTWDSQWCKFRFLLAFSCHAFDQQHAAQRRSDCKHATNPPGMLHPQGWCIARRDAMASLDSLSSPCAAESSLPISYLPRAVTFIPRPARREALPTHRCAHLLSKKKVFMYMCVYIYIYIYIYIHTHIYTYVIHLFIYIHIMYVFCKCVLQTVLGTGTRTNST